MTQSNTTQTNTQETTTKKVAHVAGAALSAASSGVWAVAKYGIALALATVVSRDIIERFDNNA